MRVFMTAFVFFCLAIALLLYGHAFQQFMSGSGE